MITEKAMREVELMIEAARLGGRPALSLELREALAELVSYYKVGHEVADGMRLFVPKDGLPRLEVSDDGETWRPLEQGSTAHNSLQLAEQVGELNGAAPAAAEPVVDHFEFLTPSADRPRFQGSCIFGLPYVPGRATIHGLPEDGE